VLRVLGTEVRRLVILLVQQTATEGTNWDKWVAVGTLLLALATFALAAITFRWRGTPGRQ
jgi:hypothetical protein